MLEAVPTSSSSKAHMWWDPRLFVNNESEAYGNVNLSLLRWSDNHLL